MWTVAGPSGVRVARHASRPSSSSQAPCPIGARVRARSSGRVSPYRASTPRSLARAAPPAALPPPSRWRGRDSPLAGADRELEDEGASAPDLGIACQVAIVHARDLADRKST